MATIQVGFGMGIDCGDVREVVHVGAPDDVVLYSREVVHVGAPDDMNSQHLQCYW